MLKRPIDSFVEYFLDVKPYHTKILEVVEQYLFSDEVNVSISENIFFTEMWRNDPYCKGIGFGYDFDDDCGYSALSCCDLFDCYGGYGLIFDNYDLLIESSVIDISERGTDIPNSSILEYGMTISGDHRFDSYYQIDSIIGTNTLRLAGNVLNDFLPHALFAIESKNTYLISETAYNGFYIAGNRESQFYSANEFIVMNSGINDDLYAVYRAQYIPSESRTFVEVYGKNLDINSLGSIIVKSGTKNNGIYQREDLYSDGTYTYLTVNENSPLKLPSETRHGSVVLRTGFLPNRKIWIDYSKFETDDVPWNNPMEVNLTDVTYDYIANTTTLYIQGNEQFDLSTIDLNDDYLKVQLRGYLTGAGFDGWNECSTPKPNHLYVSIAEYLQITEITPAPTPTPEPPTFLGNFYILGYSPAPPEALPQISFSNFDLEQGGGSCGAFRIAYAESSSLDQKSEYVTQAFFDSALGNSQITITGLYYSESIPDTSLGATIPNEIIDGFTDVSITLDVDNDFTPEFNTFADCEYTHSKFYARIDVNGTIYYGVLNVGGGV